VREPRDGFPTLTFATISRFNPAIRFADIVETASADRAAQ
jgi:hypothetical protein